MRKTLTFAALAACAIATPALAQDWTGAYAGISGGGSDIKSDQSVVVGGSWASEPQALQDFVTATFPTDGKDQNINYGAQIGYNVQAAGGLVIGVEADVSGLAGKEVTTTGPVPYPPGPTLTYTVTNTLDPKVTYGVKGKLGFAAGDMMFYATGGWSWTQADIAVDILSNANYHKTAAMSHTFDGWQVGGGIEQRVSPNLSLRLDYAYSDQGDVTYDTAYAAGSAFAPPAFNYTETYTQDFRMHLLRVGINMHF
jgi:opacity protein-like surface antigen